MPFLNREYTRECLALAFPVMITQVGQVSVNLFDNIIVGKMLGADALASVSLANAIFYSTFVIALGFSFAIPPLISEAHARHDSQTVNSVFAHGLMINMAVGIILTMALFISLPLLYYSGQPAKIIPGTIDFLQIVIISIIPFMAFQALRGFSEGLSYTAGVTKATVIANVINIVLNYVLIKGVWGIPPMGIRGSAVATLTARIFMVVFLYFVLFKENRTKSYLNNFSLKMASFSKSIFFRMIQIGLPTALQMFFEVTAFASAAFICGLISADQIAAHQIVFSMASFTYNLCIGFGVTATVMMARKLGEKKFTELRKVGINNIKITFIFMLLCGLLLIIGRNSIPSFFVKKEDIELIRIVSGLMIIAAVFQLFGGIQVTSLGILRGLQDMKKASFYIFIAYWIMTIPLGYFLCVYLKMGALGMWIALGAGVIISSILVVKRFLYTSSIRSE
ncbi:multidrug transporter MatE [Chryseobacterium angstadtii]|uniref:Multidrug-efflux transporter n=1 Tax=Chryseobacterium angstadtii TaxID=558151 RepID=A0A0J7KW63_9FLAO|nr:MATE family efflux transporter [Chryseobacterium angstadtii]KMQ61360.1 multidrug transporter MatE [Chryseobacterium angstadtii]